MNVNLVQSVRRDQISGWPGGFRWIWHTFAKIPHDGLNLNLLKGRREMKTPSSLHLLLPLLPFSPSFRSSERRQLGPTAWCWALLGGIDSWIIPEAAAADYQRRSHQASQPSPPTAISLYPRGVLLPVPSCHPSSRQRHVPQTPSPPLTLVLLLLTGNLNNNNYRHYWCHKQVTNLKLGQ